MKQLRIGVDGFNLAMTHGTGVATYGFALTGTLREMGHHVDGVFGIPVGLRRSLREILFYEALGRGISEHSSLPKYVQKAVNWFATFRALRAYEVPNTGLVERRYFERRVPAFDRVLSSANLFERAERYFNRTKRFYTLSVSNPPAIMHWTYPIPLRLAGAKNIYTLHDLVPLKLPYATLDRKRTYYRILARCARDADHLCTVSESSRRDIIEQFGVSPERVTNTYQTAPIPRWLLERDPAQPGAAGIFGLKPKNYFMYFGAIEPKKNVGRLVEAYLSTQTDTPIVLVGARAWQAEKDLQLVSSGLAATKSAYGRRIARQVVRLDYLPRALLLQLVADARAVLFPSLYEGFGLPVLEAMQLGTPVITSNTSSLPEVAGDAAITVDPYDTPAIAAAITRLDKDEALCAELAARGRDRARLFTTERYQERLQAMYDKTLSGRS